MLIRKINENSTPNMTLVSCFSVLVIASFIFFAIGVFELICGFIGIIHNDNHVARLTLVQSLILVFQPFVILFLINSIYSFASYLRVKKLLTKVMPPVCVVKKILSAPELFNITDSAHQAMLFYIESYASHAQKH